MDIAHLRDKLNFESLIAAPVGLGMSAFSVFFLMETVNEISELSILFFSSLILAEKVKFASMIVMGGCFIPFLIAGAGGGIYVVFSSIRGFLGYDSESLEDKKIEALT